MPLSLGEKKGKKWKMTTIRLRTYYLVSLEIICFCIFVKCNSLFALLFENFCPSIDLHIVVWSCFSVNDCEKSEFGCWLNFSLIFKDVAWVLFELATAIFEIAFLEGLGTEQVSDHQLCIRPGPLSIA